MFAVFLTAVDKYNAKNGGWRISEKLLFITAFSGGATAMLATMLKIRHKTRHKRFMIGLPIIIALHLAIIIYLFYKGVLYI